MVNNNNLNLTKEKEVAADSSTRNLSSPAKEDAWILKNFRTKP